jgi:hypothetical protein
MRSSSAARPQRESSRVPGSGGQHPDEYQIANTLLYVFLVLAHDRRRILHFGVTAHPTPEWSAQQLREAFPWETSPRYLLRDRDTIFGPDFVKQVKAMGIKQVLSAPRSPWQPPR